MSMIRLDVVRVSVKLTRLLLIVLSVATVFAVSAAFHNAAGQGLEVAGTDPADGDVNVSPALQEIVVTFSAPVSTLSYAFVILPEGEFPEVTGDPYFPDNRTCVLPVSLKPNTHYSLGVNSEAYSDFRECR